MITPTRDHYWAALKLPPVLLDTLMALVDNGIISTEYLHHFSKSGYYTICRLRKTLVAACPEAGIEHGRSVGYWMTREQKIALANHVRAALNLYSEE